MKIDITSMFFNSRIEGQTATPAWGTSIGQNKSRDCRIDDFKQEVVDMVIGMTYKSVADLDNLDVSKGSSDRDIITCSVFENVYINNKKIENAQYVLLLVREHSKSHDGRLLVSYAPYIKYNGIANQSCIDLMQQMLGCTSEGCWFVYDISIKNQSELYFSAVVVNASAPMVYSNNIRSKTRSEEWKGLIPADNDSDFVSQKDSRKLLQQIFYGAPGTGKSKTIKDITSKAEKEGRVFRTTFHPDSDYSTFVGCYKPTKVKSRRLQRMNLSLEDLAKELGSYYSNEDLGKIVGIQKFCFDYFPYIDGEYMSVNVTKLLELAGVPKDYNVEINKYIKFCHLLPKQDPDKITYNFVPQAFTNSYIKAWSTEENVYLIIEEINRGNCAQIFGDLFQLLDRGDDGKSEYPIDADTDLGNYIAKELESSTRMDFPDGVKDGKKLVLPSNLFIWATMNTSDQSLFPIDSAFKRRWDWKYLPIENAEKGWKIKVNGNEYDWYKFLDAINKEVLGLTHSEDKQLGYFFAKAKDGIIDAETLVNKVYFYLWTDVFKDYDYESQKAFRKPNSNEPIAFKDFFKKGQELDEIMAEQVLINLELEKLNKPQNLFE